MNALLRFGAPGLRGLRAASVDADELARTERWLRALAVDEPTARVLKPGTVWRVGERVVKLHPPRRSELGRGWSHLVWRDARALREARAAARIAPIPTPEPRLALALTRGERAGASLIVTAAVDGVPLGEAWDDPRARQALAGFVAAQHAAGVFHGDPHPANQLWDGARFWLIDLDGLRSPLRSVFRRRLAVVHWARLWHNLALGGRGPEPAIHAVLREYAERRRFDPQRFAGAVRARLQRGFRGRNAACTNIPRDGA